MGIDKICEIFDNKLIGGLIGKEEGMFLYNLARNIRPTDGVIVEIGSAYGLSTVCLGLGSKDGYTIPIYSIDPHIPDLYTSDPEWLSTCNTSANGTPDEKYYTKQGTGHLEFYDNIKKFGVSNVVIPIQDYSEMAYKKGLGKEWNLPIGLLFIDGDHRYNYVKLDVKLWAKNVTSGGKILFHDYPFPGVCKTIDELITGNPRYHKFRGVGKDPIVNVTVK